MSAATLGEDSEGNAHEFHMTLAVGNEFEHDSVMCVVQSVQSGVVFCHVNDAATCGDSDPDSKSTEGQVKVGDIVGSPLNKANNMHADCLEIEIMQGAN